MDNDYACCIDNHRSAMGWVYTFASSAISWIFVLQDCTSISITKVEYVAASEACKEAIWLTHLVGEIGLKQEFPILHCDSQSAIALEKNLVIVRVLLP